MSNVLTDLAADLYKAADIVGREQVGLIPSVTVNADTERVAKGDTVRSHFTRTPTVNTSFAPSMTIPEGTDQTVDNKALQLNQYASVEIPWTGEDIKHVNNGSGFETIYGDQILQAMRAITNTVESYLAGIMYRGASRAVGTAGTTPFGSNFDLIAELRQILADNGCPMNDGMASLVLSSTAGTKLRNLANLQKVNESGNDRLLRQGTLLDLQGFMLKESAGIGIHTKGTGTAYDINNGSGEAVGQTTLTLDGGTTGANGVLAGDVVTFAGDTVNSYVVKTGLLAASGDIVINDPGLRAAVADATEMTIGNSYTYNMGFHRSAVELVARPVAIPKIGRVAKDAAIDRMVVQDTHSGLVFEIAVYVGFQKAMLQVGLLYDAIVWKPQHVAILRG